MRIRNYIISILLLINALICCSCGFFGEQDYFCDIDSVESVQIVSLDKYNKDELRFDYTVLAEISDYTSFIEKLNELEHKKNWGDPKVLEVGNIVIKINYLNGDYDLIYYRAQSFYRSEKNGTGYFIFDKEQFDALISEYYSQVDAMFLIGI